MEPGTNAQTHLAGTLETATKVLTDPQGFYSSMPREGGLEAPGIFAITLLVVTGVIQAILALVGLYPGGFIVTLIATPIFGAIGLAIGAVIVMFASRALGGDASFESSGRIVAYSSAILPIQAVLGILPYAPLLASAYGMYLIIIGVIAVHRVPENKAWTVLGGIAAVLLLFSLLATMAGRRAADDLDDWQRQLERSTQELEKAAPHLEKGAEELGKAAEKWGQEMQRAAQKAKEQAEKEAAESE